jgi:anaerobic selenocysteine-containing dehydrogenase
MSATRDAIGDVWGRRTPYVGEWPERVDEYVTDAPDEWVQSACVLCSIGCGMDIGVKDGRIVGVRGRVDDRTNHGRLGPKGLYGWQANNSAQRLTQPLVKRNGKLAEATWGEAMDLIVEQSRQLKERHGADALGFYNTGQMFLEEYYTLGVMVDAGIGTNHLDGNTRLCTSTASTAYIESFGTDGHPGSYTDSTRPTRSSWSVTTWPPRARCCGHASSIGWRGRTRRNSSLWTRARPRRRSAPASTLRLDWAGTCR